ncbi:hypothetical protein G6F68_019998 [Rhizopus microsporus]|jgi:hypothetical protein|nr:hypothetical protein G6F68_019998 [Rhizopus microsporus]
MSSIKATYSTPSCNKIIEVPLDSTAIEHLTDPILTLKDQINEFLTQVLEKEKSTSSTPISEANEQNSFEEEDGEEEDGEEALEIENRPEALENQNVKKQKVNNQ